MLPLSVFLASGLYLTHLLLKWSLVLPVYCLPHVLQYIYIYIYIYFYLYIYIFIYIHMYRCIYMYVYLSVLWWCITQKITWEQKALRRYCKSTRIINVKWFFVGMLKKINKGKLEPTFELWLFLTFQKGLAPSWQYVGCQFLCQTLDRGFKVMLVFLEGKLKASITQFGLICKFSHQIQNCPI